MPEPVTGPSDSEPHANQMTGDYRSLASTALPITDTIDRVTLPPSVNTPAAASLGGPRYQQQRFHAKGGLGEVHVATDTELGREVALKRIQERFAGDSGHRERFLREAEITARLQHPGIVPVYGLTVDVDGEPSYAMRFIEGESFADAIKRFHGNCTFDSLDFRRLLQCFVSVCNTIAYAHSKGIIHRDLKPANVMLGMYGETLVVDWGLAKPFNNPEVPARSASEGPASPTAGTQLGQAIGTPPFMSPEQAAGRWDVVGPATDIYSLGAMLYVLLSNRAPFNEPNLDLLLAAVQLGKFPTPCKLNRHAPKALEAICLKAMERQPEKRYDSALELAKEVERWLADEKVGAYKEPVAVRVRRWGRRHRTLVTSIAAVLLVAALGMGLGMAVVNGLNQELAKANGQLSSKNTELDAKNTELTKAIQGELAERERRAQVLQRFINTLSQARSYNGRRQGNGG